MKFRKKSVVVEAYRLPAAGEDVPHSFYDWVDEVGFSQWESDRDEGLLIKTLEGTMRADPGDWIVKGVKGEFYPVKDEIFAATYEPAAVPQIEPKREHWNKYFAARAMQSILLAAMQVAGSERSVDFASVAAAAYRMADEMTKRGGQR